MTITVTSLRLKTLWHFFKLSLYSLRIIRQTKKQKGLIQLKATGLGYTHYTLSAWETEEDMKNFYRSGAHLDAMKNSAAIASEIRTFTYTDSQLPDWKNAKKMLFEKGKLITFGITAFFLCCSLALGAQMTTPKYNANDPALPDWVKMMYAPQANLYAVENAYAAYYQTHPFEKNSYTQYYKRWLRTMGPWADAQGDIHAPDAQRLRDEERLRQMRPQGGARAGNWTFAGPEVHYSSKYNPNDDQVTISEQANVYCIDQSVSNPDELFCGAEGGGVYKSLDKGQHWDLVTRQHNVGGISAVRIHPQNADYVLFSAASAIWKSTDGGASWNIIFQDNNFYVEDFVYHPVNPDTIFAATNKGFLRSTDNGQTWNYIFTGHSLHVMLQPGNPDVVYTTQYEANTGISRFYKSTDAGASFTVKPTGWFTVPPQDQGLIESYGAKIAVTAANPNKVYALLVGSNQAGASLTLNGFIGVYVSDDGGETWSNPHGIIGAPYSLPGHPNLMNFVGDDGTYNQIYYNTTIVASQLDENKILIGGLNMWTSTDGAASYQGVGGYIGGIPFLHVDMQELRVIQTSPNTEEVWLSCDGGINYSTDFFATHEARNRGVYAGQFWGYDQGWNEDVRVGGRYHNGNGAYHENYPSNEYLALGGGEASTGYVNHTQAKKTSFSDIGGRMLPDSMSGVVSGFNISKYPNEGYWLNESSRILVHANYGKVMYLGQENKLWKSTDGGASFTLLHLFGNNQANDRVLWIEQCLQQPDHLYAQFMSNNASRLWRSTNGGATWAQVSIPFNNYRYLFFDVSPVNPNELWVAYTDGGNNSKVYHSINGGQNWTNMTTPALAGLHIYCIAHQYGTDGGVYIACREGMVFYRNNTMPDWASFSDNLPIVSEPLRLVPFYKENKIRLATKNIGIWESDLYEASSLVAEFAVRDDQFYCPGDSVYFSNHSVCSAAATFAWDFPGGSPATSTLRNPVITYATTGTFPATLTVSENGNSATVTHNNFISSVAPLAGALVEDFEGGALPNAWRIQDPDNNGALGAVTDLASGFGTGTYSFIFDNYNVDVQGFRDNMLTPKFTVNPGDVLYFDVAYAPYGFPYVDTLAVMISTDCGHTYTTLYVKGNTDLATAPNFGASIFIPTANQWRTDSIDLSAYAGQPEAIIAFQNRGRWGQAIYIDNINVLSPLVSTPVLATAQPQLNLFPNPADHQVTLSFETPQDGEYLLEIANMQGQRVLREVVNVVGGRLVKSVDVAGFAEGVYMVSLVGNGNFSTFGVMRELVVGR